MQATQPFDFQQALSIDYKQFVREFNQYRQRHPEQRFQQALDQFMADQKSKRTAI